MRDLLKKWAGPGAFLAAEKALDVSGFKSPWLSFVLWAIAACWGGWALSQTSHIQRTLAGHPRLSRIGIALAYPALCVLAFFLVRPEVPLSFVRATNAVSALFTPHQWLVVAAVAVVAALAGSVWGRRAAPWPGFSRRRRKTVRALASTTASEIGDAIMGKTTVDAVAIFRDRYQGVSIRTFGSVENEIAEGFLLRPHACEPAIRVLEIQNRDEVNDHRPEDGYGWMLVDGVLAEFSPDAGGIIVRPSRVVSAAGNDGHRVHFDGDGARRSQAPNLHLEGYAKAGTYGLVVTNLGDADRFAATVVRCARVPGGQPSAPWEAATASNDNGGCTVEVARNDTVRLELARDPDKPEPRTLVFPRSGWCRPVTAEGNHFELTVVLAGTSTDCALEVEVWIEPNRDAANIYGIRAIGSPVP